MKTSRVLAVAVLSLSCAENSVLVGDGLEGGAAGSEGDSGASGDSGAGTSGRGGSSAGQGGSSSGRGGSSSGQGGSSSGQGGSSAGTSSAGGGSAGNNAGASTGGAGSGGGGATGGAGASGGSQGGAAGAMTCGSLLGGCCWTDADCGGSNCYDASCETGAQGRCAMPPSGGCYADRDCPEGSICVGGQLAPCGTLGPDVIGTCSSDPCPVATSCVGGPDCQCLLPGQGCVPANGPQGNGICRMANGECAECVCASPETPIATPNGERRLADLEVGDLVYSVDGPEIRPVPIARVNRVAVSNHRVLRVTFTGGAVIEMSAGHPTADGRPLAALRPGDELDGATVTAIETIPYVFSHTYDILPASESGAYFASGVLIGSTLARRAIRKPEWIEPRN